MKLLKFSALCILLFIIGATNLTAQAPDDFYIAAHSGSNAPWGTTQVIIIDSTGAVSFYESSVDTDFVDSIFTTISLATREALFDTVMASGFFSLDTLYDGGAEDGSGIQLTIGAMNVEYTVETINTAVPGVDRIVKAVNAILLPYGIELKYNALYN